MAENEGMEGKDLATDKKQEFEAQILEAIKDLKTGESTTSIEGIRVTNLGAGYTIEYEGIKFGLIDDEGKFQYNAPKFKEVKAKLEEEGKTLEDLGLPELDQSIDQEKEPKPEGQEPREEKGDEPDGEKEDKEETPEDDIEKDKERIAKELEIDPKKVHPIKTDSSFYKKHLGMFGGRNLFFYEAKDGKIKVGTLDEEGKPIEDTEHFEDVNIGNMAQVIRLGDGRDNVKKEIPNQMLGIKNPAKQKGQKDVQDRYLAVFIGEHGELEFEEVEQSSKTGKLVSTRIEIAGRDDNTEAMRERIHGNTSSRQTPGQTAENVEDIEDREQSDKNITTDEVYADNNTFYQQLKEDITKTYGPMPQDKLNEMTQNAMELIENGVDRQEAIAKVGVKERDAGGRARGEKFDPRTGK